MAVPLQRPQARAGFQVPHAQSIVPTGGDGPPAIRHHAHVPDETAVPLERPQECGPGIMDRVGRPAPQDVRDFQGRQEWRGSFSHRPGGGGVGGMLDGKTRPLAVIHQRIALGRGEGRKGTHAVQSRWPLDEPPALGLNLLIRPDPASGHRFGQDRGRLGYRFASFQAVASFAPLAGVVDQPGRPGGNLLLATAIVGDLLLRLRQGGERLAVVGLEVKDELAAALALDKQQRRKRGLQGLPQSGPDLMMRQFGQGARILPTPGFRAGWVELLVEVVGQVTMVTDRVALVRKISLADRLPQVAVVVVHEFAASEEIGTQLAEHDLHPAGAVLFCVAVLRFSEQFGQFPF